MGKDFAQGIIRSVDYDGFGAIGEFRRQLCVIQYPFRGMALPTCFLFDKNKHVRSNLTIRMKQYAFYTGRSGMKTGVPPARRTMGS